MMGGDDLTAGEKGAILKAVKRLSALCRHKDSQKRTAGFCFCFDSEWSMVLY